MKQSIIALALSMFAVGWTPAEAGTNQAILETFTESAPPLTRVAQLGQATIYAPKRIDTDQETVEFTGKIEANGEISLTVNGTPVGVGVDGSFLVRRTVPVGRSKLLLIAESSRGERVEHRVFVRRTAAGAESDEFGDYYALVIGNNDYEHLTDLRMAVVDAEAVRDMLIDSYGFEVEFLANATRNDIVSALARKRAQLTEKDNLLIYYAGHGSLDVGSDEGYWLPVDAEPDNPVNWISNNNITGQLRAMRAKHVMVVADSCYSGKLTRNVQAQLKTGAERSAWLERMASRRSRTALTSGGLEPVLDAGGGQYSVFAKAFLETLRANTRVLDGQSLFDAIKRPIVVNADQTPEYADVRKAGHDGGDFIFVPLKIEVTLQVASAEPVPATTGVSTTNIPQTSSNIAVELAFWQSIQSSNSIADHEAYLQRFPNGNFAVLVRARLNALKSQQAATTPVPAPAAPSIDIEMIYWQSIQSSNSIADHEAYLQKFPNGNFAPLVRARLENLMAAAVPAPVPEPEPEPAPSSVSVELIYWQSVRDSDSIAEHEAYLSKFPNGEFAPLVRARLETLQAEQVAAIAPPPEPKPAPKPEPPGVDVELVYWQSIQKSDSIAEHEAYLRKFPNGEFAPLVRARLDVLKAAAKPQPLPEPQPASEPQGIELAFWESVKNSRSLADYQAYLGQYPTGHFAGLARSRVATLQQQEADIVAAAVKRQQEEERKAAALKKKQEEARKAAELAALQATPQPAPEPVIDAQSLLNDSRFLKSLTKTTKYKYKIEFQRLDSVEVLNRSGNQARLMLKYLWMNDNDSQRVGRGEATVRSIGGQFEVTDFKSHYPTPSQLLRTDAGASGI